MRLPARTDAVRPTAVFFSNIYTLRTAEYLRKYLEKSETQHFIFFIFVSADLCSADGLCFRSGYFFILQIDIFFALCYTTHIDDGKHIAGSRFESFQSMMNRPLFHSKEPRPHGQPGRMPNTAYAVGNFCCLIDRGAKPRSL